MDMELTHIHVTYPLWLRVSFLATLAFPFVALYFARRAGDPLALLLIPVAGNLAATWGGLLRLAQGMSLLGGGHRAASAGGAEAQLPLEIGLALTAVVAGIFVIRLPSVRRPPLTTLTLALLAFVLLVCEVCFTWYVTRIGRTFSPSLTNFAQAAVIVSLLAFTVSWALTFRTLKGAAPLARVSIVFTLVAIACGGSAFGLWWFARNLAAVAMGA